MAKAPKGAGGGKKGDKDGGGGADAKDNKGEHGLGVTPINYFKDGKDPSVKPDEEYPEWLWNLQVGSTWVSCALCEGSKNNGGDASADKCFF